MRHQARRKSPYLLPFLALPYNQDFGRGVVKCIRFREGLVAERIYGEVGMNSTTTPSRSVSEIGKRSYILTL